MSVKMTEQIHENLYRLTKARKASDRSVGLVFSVVLTIVGLLPLLDGIEPRLWALIAAGILMLLAFTKPQLLGPLTRAWMGLGQILHVVISPIILGLIYVLAVIPTGLGLRLFRKDPLRLKFSTAIRSYWIQREPPGPAPNSLKNQF